MFLEVYTKYIKETINQIFQEHDHMLYVQPTNSTQNIELPMEIPHFSLSDPERAAKIFHQTFYVLNVNSILELNLTLSSLSKGTFWNPRGKFLIIIKIQNFEKYFKLFWSYDIYRVVIAVDSKRNYQLYYSQPYGKFGNCAKKVDIEEVVIEKEDIKKEDIKNEDIKNEDIKKEDIKKVDHEKVTIQKISIKKLAIKKNSLSITGGCNFSANVQTFVAMSMHIGDLQAPKTGVFIQLIREATKNN